MLEYFEVERQLIKNLFKAKKLDTFFTIEGFNEDLFHDQASRDIFKVLKEKHANNEGILLTQFIRNKNLDMQKVVYSENEKIELDELETKDLLDFLFKEKKKRDLLKLSEDITNLVKDNKIDSQSINSLLESAFKAFTEREREKHDFNMYEALDVAYKAFIDLQNNNESDDKIPTGFKEFDRLYGLRKKHLTVLAAQTSRGKTSLAIRMFLNALKADKKCFFFSLEMSTKELVNKIFALEQNISTKTLDKKLDNEKLAEEVELLISKTSNELFEKEVFICDKRGLSVDDIRIKARQKAKEYGGVDLIVVDYLQMVTGGKGEHKAERVGKNALALRELAGELNCNVMLLSQFNRSANESEKPKMSFIRDSGNIEEIADQIILPHRLEFDDKEFKECEEAEIIIDKGRTSGTGTIRAKFYAPIQKWAEEDEIEDIRIIYPSTLTLEEELPDLPMA